MPDDYLEMPPEQGGLRFGPLPDVVSIGSDPRSADIILAPRAGVPAAALELRRNHNGTWTVHFPEHPPHPCQVLAEGVRPGQGRSLRTGARMDPGETLMITGMTVHPRLQLVRAGPRGLTALPDEGSVAMELPDVTSSEDDSKPKRRWWPFGRKAPEGPAAPPPPIGAPKANRYATEVQRQAQSRFLTRFPWASPVYNLYWRFRKGGLNEPVVVVGAVLGILGALLAGGLTIMSLLWMLGG